MTQMIASTHIVTENNFRKNFVIKITNSLKIRDFTDKKLMKIFGSPLIDNLVVS